MSIINPFTRNYGTFNFKVRVANTPPAIDNVIKPLISLDSEAEFKIQLGNINLDSHFVIITWGYDSANSTHSLESGENTLSLKHTYSLGTEGNLT